MVLEGFARGGGGAGSQQPPPGRSRGSRMLSSVPGAQLADPPWTGAGGAFVAERRAEGTALG